MADYNANIKVNADTRQAESQLKRLQASLDKLSDISAKVNLQSAQQQFNKLGTTLRGIGERGALGAITLGAGKAAASIGGLGAKFGILGAAAASAGATINGALGGVPGVITDILAQVGNIPNAFGLAAVAAMAFAPQILKASSATVALGAAIDKAVGKQTTEKIAGVVDNIGRLNVELDATKATFESLVAGSTLNQLNNQLKDAVKESGAFHSSTEEAVVVAQQLVTVQREQRREQKAITDLIRQAQGLQPQDVRDTEVARRVALLKSREIQQKKDLQLQNQINAELAEYERLAAEVANQTKQWANNLDRIARSSRAGVLGSQSQIQARLQEFRENRRSAEIARQRSAELVARERQLAGGQYSLAQVPARGELFPGGRTQTAMEQYRAMLNEQARIQQAAASALQRSERTLIGLQAQTLRTEQDITAAKRQQQTVDERSVQIIREQNALLLEQYKSQQRVAAGVLDPASLRADRMRRVEQGRAQQRRRREMTENVAIGGAFPMLFGGGPGAVIGGAAGGLIPGNPMLSVVTSAIGGIIDDFVSKTAELGVALNKVGSTFDTLKERSLISNSEREKELQLLQDAGFAATANAAAQKDLYKIIGVSGVENLRELGSETDKLNRIWAELGVQIQAVVAGPLANLAKALNDLLQPKAVAGRVENLLGDLDPQRRKQLEKELYLLNKQERVKGVPPAQQKMMAAQTDPLNRIELEFLASVAPEKVQALLDKYGPMRVNANVELDPAQVREQAVNIVQKQLEILDITKKFSEAASAQREFDRQRYDLIQGYEESIAAIRRRVEDEITNKRLTLIQKENELLDVQASIRQESLAIGNLQAQAAAGAGLPTAARDVARQAAEAVGSFQAQELSLAEQAAKLKRDAALEALRTDIEAAKFQADTAREVSKVNTETAKKVAQFNESVRKQNEQQDTRRFEIEKQLAILRLQSIQAEFALLQRIATTAEQVKDLTDLVAAVGNAVKYVEQQKAPAAVQGISNITTQGVSFAGIRNLNRQLQITQERINAAKLALNDLLETKNEVEFKNKITAIADSIDQPLKSLNEDAAQAELDRIRRADLIAQGVRGVVAERLVEIERLKESAILSYDATIAELEKKKAVEGTTTAIQKQIDALIQRRDAIASEAGKAQGAVLKSESPRERLTGEITAIQDELNTLLDQINLITTAASAIGDAFSNSFKGVISGAMTAQEALASFFQSVADRFLDMAAQIIAKWIQMAILNTFLSLFPGGGTGTSSNGMFGAGSPTETFAGGGIFSGAGPYKFPAKAAGGPVSAGSPYMVGERGPELFVPGRSGTIVPNNKLGGDNVSVVVNVDAKGTSVQGNDQQGNQLGRVISDAVQQELIRQKRPGGLLA